MRETASRTAGTSRPRCRWKRFFDLAVSAPVFLIALPIMAGVAILVRVLLGRPVLFRQVRIGERGRPFTLLKFRTMSDASDNHGKPLPDQARLTTLGKLLRLTSLDELPQLWNVLKGAMSLVGPRPLLPEYLPRYSVPQFRRHEVKPGITGWAQVNGRNTVSWDEKFELDVWYVDHQSLGLDLRILWMTLLKVIRRDGINQQGHATMPEFLGSKSTLRERS